MFYVYLFWFLSLFSLFLFYYFSFFSVYLLFDLFSLGSFNFLVYLFYFDYYTLVFLMILFSIILCVYSFISYYFSFELNLSRFIGLLNLFILSMVLLVVSPGLVSLLLGWDGLGFISFLLVCWFGSGSSFSSSLKTFLVNRLGDSLFLVGLVWLFSFGGFVSVYSFLLLLFIALFTKSALFPFSYWLPEAMSAPTPVSALVHSSTLVVAGLYVIFRYLDVVSFFFLFILSCVGLFTLYLGSFCAIFTFDSKKLVAYSTLSQLGLLSFILGLGLYDLFYSYLLVHAVFKAALFVSVGSFMVVGGHNQDLRYLSSLWYLNPLFSLVLFFSVFSLSGFPFLSCFFFKELVLGSLFSLHLGLFFLLLFFISLLLTVFYSFRLLFIFIFNSSFFIISSWNSSYSLVSSFLFSFFILFYGLHFSFDYSLWLNVSSSFLILLFLGFSAFVSYLLIGNYNLFYNFIHVFYSLFSYFFCCFFSISYILDVNVFVFSFIFYLNGWISFLFNYICSGSFVVNLVYLIFFSICVSGLLFLV